MIVILEETWLYREEERRVSEIKQEASRTSPPGDALESWLSISWNPLEIKSERHHPP